MTVGDRADELVIRDIWVVRCQEWERRASRVLFLTLTCVWHPAYKKQSPSSKSHPEKRMPVCLGMEMVSRVSMEKAPV